MDSERRFTYRLESLMRLRAAERDAAAMRKMLAERALERCLNQCDEIMRSVVRVENELRKRRAGGQAIAVDEELRAQRYLEMRRKELDVRRSSLVQARRELAQRTDELDNKRRDAKALEKQRHRMKARFVEDEMRAALKAADEQWLRRHQS